MDSFFYYYGVLAACWMGVGVFGSFFLFYCHREEDDGFNWLETIFVFLFVTLFGPVTIWFALDDRAEKKKKKFELEEEQRARQERGMDDGSYVVLDQFDDDDFDEIDDDHHWEWDGQEYFYVPVGNRPKLNTNWQNGF